MRLPPPFREDAVWPAAPRMARPRNRRTCRASGIVPRRGTGLSRRHAKNGETRVMRRSCGRRRRRRGSGAATLSAPERSGGLFRNRRSIPVKYRSYRCASGKPTVHATGPHATRNQTNGQSGRRRPPFFPGRYSAHACECNRQGTVAAEAGRSALKGRPGREIPSCDRTSAGQTRAETQTFPAAFRFKCAFAPKRGLSLTAHRQGGRRHASRRPRSAFFQVRIATCPSAR